MIGVAFILSAGPEGKFEVRMSCSDKEIGAGALFAVAQASVAAARERNASCGCQFCIERRPALTEALVALDRLDPIERVV